MLNLQLSPRKPLNFAYSRLIFVQDAWIVELRLKMAFLIPLVVGPGVPQVFLGEYHHVMYES